MTSQTVKLSYNGDLRRVRLDVPSTFGALVSTVTSTFTDLARGGFTVQYEDDEGDYITVASEPEFAEALRIVSSLGRPSMKFNIIAVAPAAVPAAAAPALPTKEDAARLKEHAKELAKVVKEQEKAVKEQEKAAKAAVKHAKKEAKRAKKRADAAVPAPVAVPAPAAPWTGVPVDKLRTLVATLKREVAANPAPFMSALMPLLADPELVTFVMRVMAAAPDLTRMLELASRDPSLPKALRLPAVAPYLAAAGIDASSLPAAPAASPVHAQQPAFHLLPSLMEQFAAMSMCPAFACQPEPECAAAPAAADTDDDEEEDEPREVHHRVRCDGCNAFPLVGTRYKCAICPDFDLCADCQALNLSSGAHGHEFTVVRLPAPAPTTTADGRPIHAHIVCDGCNAAPIIGARFKCSVCPDYDLCAECEAKDVHAQHPLLKIRDVSQTPAGLVAILREDQHVDVDATGTVDDANCGRRVWNLHRGGGGWGWRGRGRKQHCRGWERPAARAPSTEAAAVADPLFQAAIQESLQMSMSPAASVDSCASSLPASAVSTPDSSAKQSVAMSVIKQDCEEYVARFVTHVSLTDASPITGGATVVKAWRMRNDGDKSWPAGTRLVHVGAETLGCPSDGVAVHAAAPGEAVDISITLIAPDVPGRHVGYFRLVTPAGIRFGHRIWADLFVDNSNAAAVVAAMRSPVAATPVPAVVPSPPVSSPSIPVLPAAPSALPVAPSAPPAAVQAPAVWQAQLVQLAEMGFFDMDANVRALEAHHGNVGNAVNALLSGGGY